MFDRTQFAAFARERLGLALVSAMALPPAPPEKPASEMTAEEARDKEAYDFAKHHHDLNIAIAVDIEMDRCAVMAVAGRLADLSPPEMTPAALSALASSAADPLDKACYYALSYALGAAKEAA